MAEKVKSINLIPNKGEGLTDQFLSWALTIGRLLIILTETLALSVFLYRFSLDMKISDLHDQIKNQSAIVEQFKNTEDTARDLEGRLVLAKKYDSIGGVAPKVISDIVDMGRGKVTFTNIAVENGTLKIDLQSPTTSALSSFVNSLKSYSGIAAVTIDSVGNSTTTALIKMTILGKLKS